jgi:hypothetical protein
MSSGPVAFRYTLEARTEGRASNLLPAILEALTKLAEADLPAVEGPMSATGLMEFTPLRFMMDFGHYAVIGRDGREWKGRSGRDTASLRGARQSHGQPTWLMALAGGIVEAAEQESTPADGAPLRCYAAIADLQRAAARSRVDLALPPRRTLADLSKLDLGICVDESHIRRVAFADGFVAVSVEITEFGASPPSAWDRLPDLETPRT